jgi:hypothetical protein
MKNFAGIICQILPPPPRVTPASANHLLRHVTYLCTHTLDILSNLANGLI